MSYPQIIQGGMGVAVSSWTLARAVASQGQMGVVSGTCMDTVLTRRLQLGDIGGHMRRAMEAFPIPEIAEAVYARYFVEGGIQPGTPFKSKPVPSARPGKTLTDLTVLANFVEVWLAKEGHDGPIGINLLEKIQVPTLPSLLGAMMAGVDYVIMGAGIPRAIPGILEKFSRGEEARMDINCTDHPDLVDAERVTMALDPADYGLTSLPRPKFLAVVSSALLGVLLTKKISPPVDGFVIEGPTAGGHNAPPRGELRLSESGEPIYGEKDEVDLAKFREIGLPFWLAGSYAGRLDEALREGAAGIQVGTAFAFCDESGMRPDVKARVLRSSLEGTARIKTDHRASPTGFPFKVVQDPNTVANVQIYKSRNRICDLGYLREVTRDAAGKLVYRCPAEPDADFIKKGGAPEELEGRMCVCNGLFSCVGLGQVREDGPEPVLITAGDEVENLRKFVPAGATHYTAKDVIEYLLRPVQSPELLATADPVV